MSSGKANRASFEIAQPTNWMSHLGAIRPLDATAELHISPDIRAGGFVSPFGTENAFATSWVAPILIETTTTAASSAITNGLDAQDFLVGQGEDTLAKAITKTTQLPDDPASNAHRTGLRDDDGPRTAERVRKAAVLSLRSELPLPTQP